jgi:hypothetical protein
MTSYIKKIKIKHEGNWLLQILYQITTIWFVAIIPTTQVSFQCYFI